MDERKTLKRTISPLALTPGEALVLIGFSRDVAAGERTARNMMSPNSPKPFPFKTIDVMGHRRVLLSDVYEFLGIPNPQDVPIVDFFEPLSSVDLPKKDRAGPGRSRKI